jgi:hypothetical protein
VGCLVGRARGLSSQNAGNGDDRDDCDDLFDTQTAEVYGSSEGDGGDDCDDRDPLQTVEIAPHRCVQCGANDGELTPTRNRSTLVWLHPECARFWRSTPT